MAAADAVTQVVWIKDGSRLVDAESYERTYRSDARTPLPSGYYIARWPAGTRVAHFGHEKLVFVGPYPSRHDAEAVLVRTPDSGCS